MPVLDWIGKEAVVDHVRRVPFRLLDVDPARSTDLESENLIVEGDNLDTLRALLPQYAGRVRCIYIDPPYNTGKGDWYYNDAVDGPEMRAWLGQIVGKEAEDLSRHDKWLCMMYPRLRLLWELLTEDGSIWITLDYNEVHHARALLDEVFEAPCFVATVVWQKRTSPDSRRLLGAAHDYVLVYSKRPGAASLNKLGRTDKQIGSFSNPDNDPRGPWASRDYSAQGHRKNQVYEVVTPGGHDSPLSRALAGRTSSRFTRS